MLPRPRQRRQQKGIYLRVNPLKADSNSPDARVVKKKKTPHRRSSVSLYLPLSPKRPAGLKPLALGVPCPLASLPPAPSPARVSLSPYHVRGEGGRRCRRRVGAVLEVGVVAGRRRAEGGRAGVGGKSRAGGRPAQLIRPGPGDHAGAVRRARVESQGSRRLV